MIKTESCNKVPYNNNTIHSKANGAVERGGANGVHNLTNGTSNGINGTPKVVVKSESMDTIAENNDVINGKKDYQHLRINHHRSTESVSPPASPEKTTILENGSNANSPKTNGHSSDTESIASQSSAISRASSGNSSSNSSSSLKREKARDSSSDQDKDVDVDSGVSMGKAESPPSSAEGVRRKSTSPLSSRAASSSPPGSRLESTLTITKQHKEAMNGIGASRIPSPPQNLHHLNQSYHSNNNHHPDHHQHHHHYLNGIHPPPQNHLHARLTAGTDLPSRTMNVSSPLLPTDIRNLSEIKPDPLSVVTSTSLSFHHHSMYRINGVRPEVISGGAVTPTTLNSSNSSNSNNHQSNSNSPTGTNGIGTVQSSRKSPTLSHHSRSPNSSPSNSNASSSPPSIHGSLHSPPGSTTIVAGGSIGMMNTSNGSSNHHHVNLNRTPTVIMGEAGGVRIMLWSQPGQTISPPAVNGGSSPPSSISSNNTNGHANGYGSPNSISSNSSNNNNNSSANNHHKGGLSMERLWASEALNLSTSPNNNINGQANNNTAINGNSSPLGMTTLTNGHAGTNNTINGHNNHNTNSHNGHTQNPDDDDYEQPMICMICEDRATGLHYGIITCEGCKGFFKRTVQNRRVYTCVADGTCEITKAQRNRCQYCRFKKCIEQGMVLQAVREDRMPGGRNSGAVYNLYKVPVKYRKHKKGNRVNNGKNSNDASNGSGNTNTQTTIPPTTQILEKSQQSLPQQCPPNPVQSGILKAALTSPNDVAHLRQSMPFEAAHAMITQLVQCDNFHDIAALQNSEELLQARGDLTDKLCQMGDSIVYRLVQWTKRLPFYPEVPVDVHTRVLTHKWHELLVLTTSAWQAMHTPGPPLRVSAKEETMESLQVLQRCLEAMMGRSLTLEQLRQDVGEMVERLTYLTRAFRRMNIRMEEYVCLKVITMLQNTGTRSPEVGVIQERYIKCLRTFLEISCPGHPNRLSDLLRTLPEVQAAASLLLESKMFYVPFLLNSALLQR